VFYVSDFDPGGHNMPTSVVRKFQTLRDLYFPDLDVRLYPVALTLERCIQFDLPSALLKASEKRKAKWQVQTEVASRRNSTHSWRCGPDNARSAVRQRQCDA
jgi:hypothetical protein